MSATVFKLIWKLQNVSNGLKSINISFLVYQSMILSNIDQILDNRSLCHRENRQFFKKNPHFCPFLGRFG